jgi:hypothetical protein
VSENKPLGEKVRGRSGKFTDHADSLLPLFPEPGKRDEPRWRLLFGLEPAPSPRRGVAFIARDMRQPPPRKR